MKSNILLIEDKNPISHYLLKSLLDEDYKVSVASSIDMVVQNLSNNNLFLIIVDENFASLHEGKFGLRNPTLILCDDKKNESLDSKKYFIQKPFSIQNFLLKVKQIIDDNIIDKHIISIDNLSIDTKKGLVMRGQKNITLTKKEFTLLLFLLKNKDKAVSRADLLENVWGMQIDPFSNTIEAHVFSLRKKIDRKEKTKLIHTIPKFGYRISMDK